MREINLGAIRQQFSQVYSGKRRLNDAQAARMDRHDISTMMTQGRRSLELMQEAQKEDNIRTKLALQAMTIGANRKYAETSLQMRTDLGLAKINDKQKHFYLQERRKYDSMIRGIESRKSNALDRLENDYTIRNIIKQAQFDGGVSLRAVQHKYNQDLAQVRFDQQRDLMHIKHDANIRNLLGQVDTTEGADVWRNVQKIQRLFSVNVSEANQIYRSLQAERAGALESGYMQQWLDLIGSSHNPPMAEEWRRNFNLLSQGKFMNFEEEMYRRRVAAQGGQVHYFQTPRQAARGGYLPPSQQAATSAVVAENSGLFQESMHDAAKGMALTLQQLHGEQDNWLAQSAIQAGWDKAEHLKNSIASMTVSQRHKYIRSGAIEQSFNEILDFYSNVKDPDQQKRITKAVKRYISDIKIDAELNSVPQLKKEERRLVDDANRRLSSTVLLNPSEENVRKALRAYDDVVGPLYPDVASLELANKHRDGLVYKAKLMSYLSNNKKTKDLEKGEALLNRPEAAEYLSPKDITSSFSTLNRFAEKHKKELEAKRIKSIQQQMDTYGRSKSRVKGTIQDALSLKDFRQVVSLSRSADILPEDRAILQTMVAKSRAKLTPVDGSVRGFAADEPIGYRGSQYKLGRNNQLISDANGSRDMVIENKYREAFNRMLQNDPVQLREQLLGEEDFASSVSKRKLYGGRVLTNRNALELGGALVSLVGRGTTQQRGMMSALGNTYGESADLVVEEALLTLQANSTDPVQKSRIQIARMAFNPYLQQLIPGNLVANHLRSLQSEGRLKPTSVGVKPKAESVELQEVKDSVPDWTYKQMVSVAQQAALSKASMTAGNDRAKNSVYKQTLDDVSVQLAEGLNAALMKKGEGVSIEGLSTALNGLLVQDGSLDIPRSVVEAAGIDASYNAKTFAQSMTADVMALHKDLFDSNTKAAIRNGGQFAKYKLAKREDRAGAFAVILDQGDTMFPLRLKDGSLLTALAEDIVVHGHLFTKLISTEKLPTNTLEAGEGTQ